MPPQSRRPFLRIWTRYVVPFLRFCRVIVAMFHPGSVRVEKFADLDWPGMEESPEAIGNMIRTIDGLTLEDSGKFMRNTGEPHPW